jgi:transposase
MNSIQLFQLALDLTSPWYIERVEFTEQEAGKRQLNIHINFQKGAKFLDENEHECPVHDTEERSW